jgi:uncharacterized protein YycO
MKHAIFSLLSLLTVVAHAGEQQVYQQDSLGNIQYHKPHYVIRENGRIIESDPVGNMQYHKQQYQMKDGQIFPVDSTGNIQYHKPRLLVK